MDAARAHLLARAGLFKTRLRLRELAVSADALTAQDSLLVLNNLADAPDPSAADTDAAVLFSTRSVDWAQQPPPWSGGKWRRGSFLPYRAEVALRGFLDRDPQRTGTNLLGLDVSAADPGLLQDGDVVVLATMAWLDVKDWLINAGFPARRLVVGC